MRKLLGFLFYSYVVAWNMLQADKKREKSIPEIFTHAVGDYKFSMSDLQNELFSQFVRKGIRSLFIRKRVNAYSQDKRVRIVLRYLWLVEDEIRHLCEYNNFMERRRGKRKNAKAETERGRVILEAFGLPVYEHAEPENSEQDPWDNVYYTRWARTRSRIKKLELVAETIIIQQIEGALREEGTCSPWPGAKSVFPPVGFKIYPNPPKLVVISPRGGINRISDFFVSPYLTPADTVKLESAIEALQDRENRYSAYISEIGGCANVYPTLITPTTPKMCFSTIVHEWAHVFVMFTPIYKSRDKMFMSAMNETVSEYMGKEISNKIWDSYYEPYLDKKYGKVPPEDLDPSPDKREEECNKIMSETYHMVRECLDDGRYKEAEEYMQEGLNLLKYKGYPVRRMNSAYFAFYGQYAAEFAFHAANGGLGALLHILRQNTSLRDFLYTATSCTDINSLKRTVNSAQRE